MTNLKLEDTLAGLSKYDRVYLMMSGISHAAKPEKAAWWCSIDMFVVGEGTTVSVKSDHQPTPLEAAKQCAERLVELARSASKVLPELGGGQ